MPKLLGAGKDMEQKFQETVLRTDSPDYPAPLEELAQLEARRAPKSCRAVSLSAWVAMLTCLIIVFQVGIGFIDTLIKNEQFWVQTNAIIEAYAKRLGCVNVSNNN